MISKLRRHSSAFLLFVSIGTLGICNAIFVQYSEHLNFSPSVNGIVPIFLVGALFLIGTICNSLARGTIFPSFIVALFIGLSMHDLLEPLVENVETLSMIVTIAAIYILFGGGLEISFTNFKKIVIPTFLISFVGLGVSTFLFAQSLVTLNSFTGVGMSVSIALLLGAILASTDPAAIIPVLRDIKFKKPNIRDIVVSESALTDVTGTIVAIAFVAYIKSMGAFDTVLDGFKAIGSSESIFFLLNEVGVGVCVGVVGFWALRFFMKQRVMIDECHADIGFFIAVPVMAFSFAVLFGGSGYLASFIAGLLVVLHSKVHRTETFFNQLVEGVAKPSVFVALGAMVDIGSLMQYAVFGILAGILFIFVVRPISVFVSLGFLRGKSKFTIKELLFMSWIRETGVIPAVLLVQIAHSGLSVLKYNDGANLLISVGMWVIMMTLIIQPPLTKWVAEKLSVGE
jgi:NhaP-type Na+/H+ or K+/H+ antiporter